MLAQRVLNEDMACCGCKYPDSSFEMMVLWLVYMCERGDGEGVRVGRKVRVVVGDESGGRIKKNIPQSIGMIGQ